MNHRADDTPEELRGRATSLGVLSEQEHSRTDVLVELLGALWPNLSQLAASPVEIARRANRCCLQHGRDLVLDTGQTRVLGRCLGIADDGALLLDTSEGPQKFYSGALVH